MLKQKNAASLDKGGHERYMRARSHAAELMKCEQHRYAIAPSLGRPARLSSFSGKNVLVRNNS